MNLHHDSGEESLPPVTSPTAKAAATDLSANGATDRPSDTGQGSGEVDRGAQLMQLWQAGDDAAFDELVHLYSGHVYALLTRFLGRSHSGREDLVQEVFLRVLGAKERYEPKARFTTWLYSICWRMCINDSARSGRRRTGSLDALGVDADGDGGAQFIDESALDPSANLEQGDLARAVRAAIAALPDSQRIAIVLSRYHQLSHAEIASVVDSTEKAVKSLIHRARETLRLQLQPIVEEELS
jgi:RNA polymerase sigma-70 factor (ECF subfamily)